MGARRAGTCRGPSPGWSAARRNVSGACRQWFGSISNNGGGSLLIWGRKESTLVRGSGIAVLLAVR
jgi:hypothetical protein